MNFQEWLKEYVLQREGTNLVRDTLRGKSFEEIMELLEVTESEEIKSWLNNYKDINFWYEVSEDFYEISKIDVNLGMWKQGELFFYASKEEPVGAMGETEEVGCVYWGIKNETHLNLKLKEWASIWESGLITLQDARMMIPEKYRGEKKPAIHSTETKNAVFEASSEKRTTKDGSSVAPTKEDVSGQKNEILSSVISYWGFKRADKSKFGASLIFWVLFTILFAGLCFLAMRHFDDIIDSQKSNNEKDDSGIQKLTAIQTRHMQEALRDYQGSSPPTRKVIEDRIQELRNNLHLLPDGEREFMNLQLDIRTQMVDLTLRNGLLKFSLRDVNLLQPELLSQSQLNKSISLLEQSIKVNEEIVNYNKIIKEWILNKTNELNIKVSNATKDKSTNTIKYQNVLFESNIRLYKEILELHNFMKLESAHFRIENELIVFESETKLRIYNVIVNKVNTSLNKHKEIESNFNNMIMNL